jgi:hypothetical protein
VDGSSWSWGSGALMGVLFLESVSDQPGKLGVGI